MLTIAMADWLVNGLGLDPKEAGRTFSEKLGMCNLKQKSIKNILKELDMDIQHLAERANLEHAREVARSIIGEGKNNAGTSEDIEKAGERRENENCPGK